MSGPPPVVTPNNFKSGAIFVTRGKSAAFRFQVINDTINQPVDITLWPQFRFTAKQNIQDSDTSAIIFKSLGLGIAFITPSKGIFEVDLSPSDTASLPDSPNDYFAEVQAEDNFSSVWTLWQGEMDLLPTVTGATP